MKKWPFLGLVIKLSLMVRMWLSPLHHHYFDEIVISSASLGILHRFCITKYGAFGILLLEGGGYSILINSQYLQWLQYLHQNCPDFHGNWDLTNVTPQSQLECFCFKSAQTTFLSWYFLRRCQKKPVSCRGYMLTLLNVCLINLYTYQRDRRQ